MSWHYLAGGTIAGCGGGSPCEQVLSSHWSTIAGILPVSGLATGVYLAMLVAGLFIGPATEESLRRLAWSMMLILAGSIAGSAIWFTILQKWIIREFCPYCMTTHITGILLAALIFWRAIREKGEHETKPVITLLPAMGRLTGGLILAGILIAIQVGFTPPDNYSDEVSPGNTPSMDYHSVPIVGSPDAPYVVSLLFDYQCPHCQKLHFILDDAIHRYKGRLAFVLCPAPLNPDCNPYIPRVVDEYKNSCELAKIGLAVWLADREAFPAFENWMFIYEAGDRWIPRSPGGAREKAIELVGRSEFNAALSDPWINQYLKVSSKIYGSTIQGGQGGIPKLVFGTRWVIPEVYNADDLVRILQSNLAVPGI